MSDRCSSSFSVLPCRGAADARRPLHVVVLQPLPADVMTALEREDSLVFQCMNSSVKLQLIALSPSVHFSTSGTEGHETVA